MSRWLGHHDAAFTLKVYAHLLDSGLGEPISLAAEIAQGDNVETTGATQMPGLRPAATRNRDTADLVV